jgi:aspartate/methionine/tyrosine aminotransferase
MRETLRMQSVQAPIIPIVGDLVRAHPGTISLGQGVVHWPPPREALDAAARFGKEPREHLYGPVAGSLALTDAIEKKLWEENRIRVQPGSRIVVTAGGNMGFMNAVLAITDPGDEIILNAPYYFNHDMAIALADCKTLVVPTDENYQLQPEALRSAITDRTRAVVTISPNNPTGAVYPDDALYEVNQICRESGLYHISDEAYEHFVYNGARHFSPASIAESAAYTISLFSMSKSFGMASWRMGYMVLPEALLTAVKKIQDTILICPPAIAQAAAAAALSHAATYPRQRIESLAKVRQTVLRELAAIRDFVDIPEADGAFYFLLRVHTQLPALHLVERLVRDYHVAAIPGDTFGMTGGCYLRVAYGALSPETVSEGIGRLVRGLREIVLAE